MTRASNSVRQCVLFFFFSSRRRHTRFDCDWSSDVCSSDLDHRRPAIVDLLTEVADVQLHDVRLAAEVIAPDLIEDLRRSEERRVGKECRSAGSPCLSKKDPSSRFYSAMCTGHPGNDALVPA